MSGAAKSSIQERDLTTRVPSFPGLYVGLVLDAKKGDVMNPTLITSETDFLRVCTPDNTVGVGYDTAHYSALAYLNAGNKLWVVRPSKAGHRIGGASVPFSGGVTITDHTPLSVGFEDPDAYIHQDECMVVHAKDPGEWAQSVSYEIVTADIAEPGAALLKVYYAGQNDPVEQFLFSRVPGSRDGFNRSLYIEDVIKASNYVRVIDNLAVDENELPTATTAKVSLAGGADGDLASEGELMLAASLLSNRNSYQMTLLLSGGNPSAAYSAHLVNIAEQRQDCVAMLNVPYSVEASSNYLNDIVNYRKDTLNISSSYAALYVGQVKIYDKFNDREIWVSPEGFAAGVVSKTAANFEIWYPSAGYRRGVISVRDVLNRFTDGELDLLYDNGINPIKFTAGRGITVHGQKTLLARPSALDRLGNRLTLTVVEPAVQEALDDFLFEYNDAGTRSLVYSMLASYMEDIKARKGVADYNIVVDETNNTPVDQDNNRMNVWLFVKFRGVAEFIRTTVILTPNSISFSVAEEAIQG